LPKDPQQAVISENVRAGNYSAYLARPSEGKNLVGVLILHEIYGLTDSIRNTATRFASEGYVALAVDLYSNGRNRPLCIFKTGMDLLVNANKSQHMGELDEAIKFLQSHPQIDANRIGIIGFCMGGGYALAFAVHSQQLKAASIFYGTNPRPLKSVANACPVVGSYADRDPFIKTKIHPNQARKLEQMLEYYNRPHDIKIYPHTKHSFFDDTSKAYNPEAAADSWHRTLLFFNEHLK
jgi:carboxymethylenebutenolidase